MFVRRLGAGAAIQPCQSTFACPGIWELSDGDFAAIGDDLTALAGNLPPDTSCAPNERIVRLPREVLIRARRDIPKDP